MGIEKQIEKMKSDSREAVLNADRMEIAIKSFLPHLNDLREAMADLEEARTTYLDAMLKGSNYTAERDAYSKAEGIVLGKAAALCVMGNHYLKGAI